MEGTDVCALEQMLFELVPWRASALHQNRLSINTFVVSRLVRPVKPTSVHVRMRRALLPSTVSCSWTANQHLKRCSLLISEFYRAAVCLAAYTVHVSNRRKRCSFQVYMYSALDLSLLIGLIR